MLVAEDDDTRQRRRERGRTGDSLRIAKVDEGEVSARCIHGDQSEHLSRRCELGASAQSDADGQCVDRSSGTMSKPDARAVAIAVALSLCVTW